MNPSRQVAVLLPRLVLLTDEAHHPGSAGLLMELCRAARPGTVAVVLRDRELTVRARLELGRRLRAETRAPGQGLIVADRVDLARSLEADGVHLAAAGLLPSEVRALGSWSWLSRSHHHIEDLPQSELRGLSHVLVSPAFAERKGNPPLGLDGLVRRLAELRLHHPGLGGCALGGVTAEHCHAVLGAGFAAVCVMGGVRVPGEGDRLLRALGIARVNG